MKRIYYLIMALCYNSGMLSPPNLAYCPSDLASNSSVPQCVSVAVGTASGACKREAMNASIWKIKVVPGPQLPICAYIQTPADAHSFLEPFHSFF
jgi:hypothetical protein